MKITIITPALVAVLGLALAGAPMTSKAQSTNAAPAAAPAPAKAKSAFTPYKGKISAIDASSVTVTTKKGDLKLTLDATGKVTNASAEGSNLKGAILPCIGAAVSGVSLPGPPPDVGKKGTKAAATLQLSPGASGMSATIDPGWLAKASKRK